MSLICPFKQPICQYITNPVLQRGRNGECELLKKPNGGEVVSKIGAIVKFGKINANVTTVTN